MPRQRIITPRSARNAAWLLALLIVIAGLINVPWALSRHRSRLNARMTPAISKTLEPGDYTWPSATPHATPWPEPDMQEVFGNFGCRFYAVRAHVDTGVPDNPDQFVMEVQHLGWPLPVIEQKHMWWPDNDPRFLRPPTIEPDPSPFILWPGLILNPLIGGGGAWLLLLTLTLGPIVLKRWHRRRHHRCLACGYPVGESPVCTECGESLNLR